MRSFHLVLVLLLALSCSRHLPMPRGTSWDETSSKFVWWGGEVRLPKGFSYRVDQGTDTFEGHFSSADGAVVVRHDIGSYAGAWASRKRGLAFNERFVEGARVWTAKRDWPDGQGGRTVLVVVTFPDSGCANFFAESSSSKDAATIEFIANSFRPKGLIRRDKFCSADR